MSDIQENKEPKARPFFPAGRFVTFVSELKQQGCHKSLFFNETFH